MQALAVSLEDDETREKVKLSSGRPPQDFGDM